MAVRDCYENQAAGFSVPFTGEIHPVADLFPMMTDDELDDLAADIKANGLIYPIVLDDEGRLIDGRNRLEGCRRADMPPVFTALNGQEAVSFILSCNVARRHLNKNQLTMLVAQAETDKLSVLRGAKASTARRFGIHPDRLSEALLVVENEPEYADNVIAGHIPFQQAVEKTKRRVAERAGDLDKAEKYRQRLETLRRAAADLAGLVDENRMPIDEAEAAAETRKRQERERVASLTRRFDTVLTVLDPASMEADDWAADWLNADPSLIGERADFSAQRALRAADTLTRYARLKKEKDRG